MKKIIGTISIIIAITLGGLTIASCIIFIYELISGYPINWMMTLRGAAYFAGWIVFGIINRRFKFV